MNASHILDALETIDDKYIVEAKERSFINITKSSRSMKRMQTHEIPDQRGAESHGDAIYRPKKNSGYNVDEMLDWKAAGGADRYGKAGQGYGQSDQHASNYSFSQTQGIGGSRRSVRGKSRIFFIAAEDCHMIFHYVFSLFA